MEDPQSTAIRQAAFAWLEHQVAKSEGTVARSVLAEGFEFQNQRVRVIGPQGIFKPAQIREYPLSITTTTKGPYNDSFENDSDLLSYAYRGTDPEHHENRGLRAAMRDQVPLIYFYSTVPGQYLVVFPVFIVGDHPATLRFTVAVDEPRQLSLDTSDSEEPIRRRYVTRIVRGRMHQGAFRDRVLRAYNESCTVCNLKHTKLLDAAHITPDNDPTGEPMVSNGLSMCKLHHAAFDQKYFGIKRDYRIMVQPKLLKERDGPMLKHGLQGIDTQRLQVPRRVKERPDPERLNTRFEEFMSTI